MADSRNVWAATIPADGAAVFAAPLGTDLPTDATSELGAEFVDLGWVSEEGVSNSIQRETTKHYAWGGDVVKTTQDRYTETFKLALLESSPEVLRAVYGEDAVTEQGDAGHSGRRRAIHGLLPTKAVLVDLSDRVRQLVPVPEQVWIIAIGLP
jgi:hypothetical protein